MSGSKPKLKKEMKAFTYTKRGKFFHLQSAILSSPIYPKHAEAFKTTADMALAWHESVKQRPHHDALLFPVLYLYRHCRPPQDDGLPLSLSRFSLCRYS